MTSAAEPNFIVMIEVKNLAFLRAYLAVKYVVCPSIFSGN